MGGELILIAFTYAVGLGLFLHGLFIIAVGRVVLSRRDREPIRGIEARGWGLVCVLLAVLWFRAITWAWGRFGRV